jgi:hypothetical protein
LAGHGFGAEPAAQNEPAAQGPGVTVPTGQLLPATQATQVAFEPWPVALEDVPAGQRVGALAAGQNEPAGHRRAASPRLPKKPAAATHSRRSVAPAGETRPRPHGSQALAFFAP